MKRKATKKGNYSLIIMLRYFWRELLIKRMKGERENEAL